MSEKAQRVTPDMNRSKLEAHLEKYRDKAIGLGASNAKIVRVEDIPVERGVVAKCRIPRCFGYGMSANCPPHAPKPAELKELLQDYEWSIFFIRHVPTELLLRDRGDKERRGAYKSIYDIVSKIESMAFYDGHYLAFGLGAGSCKSTFCGPDKDCRSLEGEACRFPVIARPSMESVGINVYRMVSNAGWDIYPIGRGISTAEVPTATMAGLVIIQ